MIVCKAHEKQKAAIIFYPDKDEFLNGINKAQTELKGFPRDPYLHNEIGMMYFSIGAYEKALSYLKMSNRLQPHSVSFKINLARCYMLNEKYVEARETLQQCLREEDFQHLYEKITKLFTITELLDRLSQAEYPQEKEILLLRIARSNLSLGYLTQAFDNLKQIFRLNPNSKSARSLVQQIFGHYEISPNQ